jgi:hypothetical protein
MVLSCGSAQAAEWVTYLCLELGYGKSLMTDSKYDESLPFEDNLLQKLYLGISTHAGIFREYDDSGLFGVFGFGKGPYTFYFGAHYDYYFIAYITNDFKVGFSLGGGLGVGAAKMDATVSNTSNMNNPSSEIKTVLGISPYLQIGLPIYVVKKFFIVQPFINYYFGFGYDFLTANFSNDFGYDWQFGITVGVDLKSLISAFIDSLCTFKRHPYSGFRKMN